MPTQIKRLLKATTTMKVSRLPKKLISLKAAAHLLGYRSGSTIKRLHDAGIIKLYRRPDAGRTTPWMASETEILRYGERFCQ